MYFLTWRDSKRALGQQSSSFRLAAFLEKSFHPSSYRASPLVVKRLFTFTMMFVDDDDDEEEQEEEKEHWKTNAFDCCCENDIWPI